MIEILSLPRRPKEIVAKPLKSIAKSGLPINSLPGWEYIPLNSKLPMLKCPGNQVIFTKNKIGKSIQSNRKLINQFDPSGRENYPEYNALHDSNLRNFYANERNLKRLRTNGEITEQNDVICNLKDFNEYRQQLHKSQLHFILQMMNRLEEEQHDRMLITNAENIAARDQTNQSGQRQGFNQVLQRKYILDQQKAEKFQKLWELKLLKFSNIKLNRAQAFAAIRQQKTLREMQMRKHWDVRHDIQRRRLISLKKLFHLKNDRMQKNLFKLQERLANKDKAKQIKSWNKRLNERIANEDRMQLLLRAVEEQRSAFIAAHIAAYKEKWLQIEEEIRQRAAINQKKLKSWISPLKEKSAKKATQHSKEGRHSFCTQFQLSFDNLMDEEVCRALNTALDLEDNIAVPFEADDPIYKAAQFIMKHIVNGLHRDLTGDKAAFVSVQRRVENFFEDAKKFVIFRATQIISAARDSLKEVHGEKGETNGNKSNSIRHASYGRVSFSRMSNTIGISSYKIHPLIEVREVGDRRPTPAGSLDSIVVDSTTSLAQKTPSSNLCRNELVFVEHFVVKFKRELLVGVGRRVFAAIECHFSNKIMNVRQELLELDRKFLINQVTKSILGYGVNPLNFESMLRLSISALSNDITWSLQQVLLKPERDPRRIARPNIRHNCQLGGKGMCIFCGKQ